MGKIIIEIDKEGDTTYKTVGFKGKACQFFAKKWKDTLKMFGVEHEDEEMTPTSEMYEQEGVTEHDRLKTGN